MTSPTQQNPGDDESSAAAVRGAQRRGRIPGILLRVILALWLIAILGPLAAIGILVSGWQPERLKTLIELVVARTLDHELRIGHIEGSLWDGMHFAHLTFGPAGGS